MVMNFGGMCFVDRLLKLAGYSGPSSLYKDAFSTPGIFASNINCNFHDLLDPCFYTMKNKDQAKHIFYSFLNVKHQLGSNRNARHQLERDLANKDGAIGIDHTCHQV